MKKSKIAQAISIDSENNASVEVMGTLKHLSPSGGGHPAAVAIGIDGGEVGFALRAEPSHSGDKGDGGVNTTLVAEVAPTVNAGGNNTGGSRFYGTTADTAESLIPEVCSSVTSKWAKSSGGPSGDECQNLTIAFPARMSGTQCAKTKELSTAIGASNPTAIAQNGDRQDACPTMAVRRLTPRECERLQGFPDDFTRIPSGIISALGIEPDPNNPKHWACDGPRYKAIGNSMAVPVIEWLGRRIDLVDELLE